MKNVLLVVQITGYWNDTKESIGRECYVGVYGKETPEVDSFFWFRDVGEIVGDHGDFTVTDYRVSDTNNNNYLKKLEEYDDYMTTKCESEGYGLPISMKLFKEIQVTPVGLENLDLKNREELETFMRFKDLYLMHSVEVMDATEISNTPVCFNEWLEYEAQGDSDD